MYVLASRAQTSRFLSACPAGPSEHAPNASSRKEKKPAGKEKKSDLRMGIHWDCCPGLLEDFLEWGEGKQTGPVMTFVPDKGKAEASFVIVVAAVVVITWTFVVESLIHAQWKGKRNVEAVSGSNGCSPRKQGRRCAMTRSTKAIFCPSRTKPHLFFDAHRAPFS